MFKNYLKISLRNLKKFKVYSLINIAGLAIGLAVCILILLWVNEELSFDRFFNNSQQIYRIVSENHAGGNVTKSAGSPAPIGPTLLDKYPEVKNFTRVQSGWSGWYLHYGEKNFSDEKLACSDPSFFEIFNFKFIKGDPKTCLKERYSIILTEALAKKCFGEQDPLGKVMQISNNDMQVTGVIQNAPENSHLQFDYVFPIINMTDWRESKINSWKYTQFATYVQLEEKAAFQQLNSKINGIVREYDPESKLTVHLQPLKNIHLQSNDMNSWMIVYPNPGNITYVYLFSIIAVCILLVACINFMNLSTARAGTRIKEIGVRKVSGAKRKDLFIQFLNEALLLTLIASALAVLLVEFLLPIFNEISGKQLDLNLFENYYLLVGIFSLTILTGVLSGSYPAIYLSSFNPSGIFKTKSFLSTRKSGILRKVLVVGQFAFATILITASMVIFSQLNYIQNKNLGYDEENIICFASRGEFGRNYEATKNELLQNPDVVSVCLAFPPAQFGGTTDIDWEGKDPNQEIVFSFDTGDYDYFKTFNFEMAEGRYYSRKFPSDTANFVVNETAVKVMGFESPIGKRFRYKNKKGHIIGVVKDYHSGSLHSPIMPKIVQLSERGFFVCVKYREKKTAEILTFMEQEWKKNVRNRPFRYNFVDESINKFYENENNIGRIFKYFTGVAIFIACLGLFGLASFMTEIRTKEIGIRKVLGASVPGIMRLLNKEFLVLIALSNLFAWIFSYQIIKLWLQNFAYHIELSWYIFVISGLLSIFIVLVVVSIQSVRVAFKNPVESLRYE
jgi:putative ABC transport system permease protein